MSELVSRFTNIFSHNECSIQALYRVTLAQLELQHPISTGSVNTYLVGWSILIQVSEMPLRHIWKILRFFFILLKFLDVQYISEIPDCFGHPGIRTFKSLSETVNRLSDPNSNGELPRQFFYTWSTWCYS